PVEALDGPHQAEVPLLDQVLQAEPLAEITPRDVHHQPQVGLDHVLACRGITLRNSRGELALFLRREQRGVVDVVQVNLQRRVRLQFTPKRAQSHEGSLLGASSRSARGYVAADY